MTLRPPPPLTADQLDAPSPAPPPEDDPIAGYSRPEPAPTDAPGVPGIGPDEVAAFLSGLGDAVATLRNHPHWRIEPGEVALPSAAIARQLSQPDTALAAWLAQHADAVLIVFGLGIVIVPRTIAEFAWIRWEREQQQLAQQQLEVPGYGGYATGGAAAEPPSEPAAGGAGRGLSADGAEGGTRVVASDPERVAAAVGSIIGG